MDQTTLSPGNIIRARGREWIVLEGSSRDILKVRPVSGSHEDETTIFVPLEEEKIRPASFEMPAAEQISNHESAVLLRDALVLSMRRGAGPFRSFGQIAVEPRAYQLVPLLMALKLDTVRLLIADDVGIGKTIESALILREFYDRGDISAYSVLCPPHLVEQWCEELENRFHFAPVAVTDATAKKLERGLPAGESLFKTYPQTVVSLDYIKSERRRDEFARACPSFVIVDEAHTCTIHGSGRQQRFELLKKIAADDSRHMVLLTATPHSGDETAFYNLLSLLNAKFADLLTMTEAERRSARDRELSKHFVQRRRGDIAEWQDNSVFPKRESAEATYQLKGDYKKFFEAVFDYCKERVEAARSTPDAVHECAFGMLALLRCVSSSPAAARSAIYRKCGLESVGDALAENRDSDTYNDFDIPENRVLDSNADEGGIDDLEPVVADGKLEKLRIDLDKILRSGDDPKLKTLTEHLEKLLAGGFRPVIFCRYIATAEYLEKCLGKLLPKFEKSLPKPDKKEMSSEYAGKCAVRCVTGRMVPEMRRTVIEEMDDIYDTGGTPILVATDCLSEGINLQRSFNAVIHYDLSWNPTRHEQREGRVDRFGQSSHIVRALLMYGKNNRVDGTVLDVIIRKAQKIRKATGVTVPLPDDSVGLTALLESALFNHKIEAKQGELFDSAWRSKIEKAGTIFAQARIKPAEVLPEFAKSIAALGSQRDVERFTCRAFARLNCTPQPLVQKCFKVPLSALPAEIAERFEYEKLPIDKNGAIRIDFDFPAHERTVPVQRSHPVVSILAESLLEHTLSTTAGDTVATDLADLGRTGAWTTEGVSTRTTVALLRIRHRLSVQRADNPLKLLVEEASAAAWQGTEAQFVTDGVLGLLEKPAVGELNPAARSRIIRAALDLVVSRRADIEALAAGRAAALLEDHRRIRAASNTNNFARVSYAVEPILPVDIIGVYVLMPAV